MNLHYNSFYISDVHVWCDVPQIFLIAFLEIWLLYFILIAVKRFGLYVRAGCKIPQTIFELRNQIYQQYSVCNKNTNLRI